MRDNRLKVTGTNLILRDPNLMITQHQSAHTVVAVVRGTEVMARIKKVLESSAML